MSFFKAKRKALEYIASAYDVSTYSKYFTQLVDRFLIGISTKVDMPFSFKGV